MGEDYSQSLSPLPAASLSSAASDYHGDSFRRTHNDYGQTFNNVATNNNNDNSDFFQPTSNDLAHTIQTILHDKHINLEFYQQQREAIASPEDRVIYGDSFSLRGLVEMHLQRALGQFYQDYLEDPVRKLRRLST